MVATTDSKTAPGVVNRLIRTLSTKRRNSQSSAARTKSPLPMTAEVEEKQDVSMIPVLPTPSPKRKWPAIARLRNLGKLKEKPPQPLAGDDNAPNPPPNDAPPTPPTAEDGSKQDGRLATVTEDSGEDPSKQEPPDPTELAQRIQALIDSLPTPTPGVPPTTPKPHPPARGRDGRPIPPPGSSPIKDPLLMALLQDASFMNGSPEEGKPSIWSMLDDMGAPTHADSGEGGRGGDKDSSSGDFSVMMCVPLVPSKNSKVEMAKSVMVNVEQPAQVAPLWKNMWPWHGKKGKPSVTPAPPPDHAGQGEAGQGKGKKVVIKRRVWVPSTTQVSVQALWWGYRIYLPPPVIAVLDSKEREAVKIAAIVTTALQFLFSHIPIAMVPLPLQPTVLLLQRIAPYLGYIGSLIAWSWGAIKSFDQGNGVVLTATWLLPVALLPSTMHPPGVSLIVSRPSLALTPDVPGRDSVEIGGKVPPDKEAVPVHLHADSPVMVDARVGVKGKGRFW